MSNSTLENKIDELHDVIKNQAPRVGAWDYHETYHTACLKEVNVKGLWLEFGVYRGRSINTIAKQISEPIYGFDSFEGLPETWDHNNPKGVFSLRGSIPAGAICGSNDDNPGMYDSSPTITTEPWEKNVILIKGWFHETLPFFLKEHKEKVAFVHIDSDIYSAANTVITSLEEENRFQNGTLVLFDEICDYPDYRNHEIKALAEFLLRTNYGYECLYHQGEEANRFSTDPPNYSQACFRIIIEE